MVYWFTGQPGHGKTVLGKKLHSFYSFLLQFFMGKKTMLVRQISQKS